MPWSGGLATTWCKIARRLKATCCFSPATADHGRSQGPATRRCPHDNEARHCRSCDAWCFQFHLAGHTLRGRWPIWLYCNPRTGLPAFDTRKRRDCPLRYGRAWPNQYWKAVPILAPTAPRRRILDAIIGDPDGRTKTHSYALRSSLVVDGLENAGHILVAKRCDEVFWRSPQSRRGSDGLSRVSLYKDRCTVPGVRSGLRPWRQSHPVTQPRRGRR